MWLFTSPRPVRCEKDGKVRDVIVRGQGKEKKAAEVVAFIVPFVLILSFRTSGLHLVVCQLCM